MTFRRFMKSGYTKGMIALLLAQQLTACGGGSSSAPVSITVGDATVTMSAPGLREDNITVLLPEEIGGFRVYYGSASGDYQREIDISGSNSNASATVSDLPEGDYFFVVTIYDTEGRESLYSSEVKITI